MMIVTMYLTYLAASVALAVWVGGTLFRSGRVFLVEVFKGKKELADSVNRLLVVGFYLVNLGFVSLALKTTGQVLTSRALIEGLADKLGIVMLVLGAMHFFNMLVFSKMRKSAA